MIIFNVALSIVCLWLFLWLNHFYFRPAKVNSYRFELFALRDKLAILAMKGQVDEKDKDYRLLINLLNTSISVMADFSIFHYLRVMYEITHNQKTQDDIKRMSKNLRNHNNAEFSNIARQYFDISHRVFHSNTRLLRWSVIPVLSVVLMLLKFVFKYCKFGGARKIVYSFITKKESFNAIDSSLDGALKSFQAT